MSAYRMMDGDELVAWMREITENDPDGFVWVVGKKVTPWMALRIQQAADEIENLRNQLTMEREESSEAIGELKVALAELRDAVPRRLAEFLGEGLL